MPDVWPILPRGWFESRRHYRRRVAEYEARFAERYEVTTLPGGEKVAVLRVPPAVLCEHEDQRPR